MRTYNAIGSIIAAVVNESIHIHTLHALIGQYPKETSGTTGMLTHHFPIIIQSGSVSSIVQSMQKLGRHKYFRQTHIVLAFSVRTIVHGFISTEVALRMKHRTFLRIIFMEFTIQFSIPAFSLPLLHQIIHGWFTSRVIISFTSFCPLMVSCLPCQPLNSSIT